VNYLIYIGFVFTAGMLIPIQTAMNVQMTKITGNALVTAQIVFMIAATIGMLLLICIQRPSLSLDNFRSAPITAWGGGFIAIFYISTLAFTTPKLGLGQSTALVLTGQIISAALLDHFGAFGTPPILLNTNRIVGIIFDCRVFIIKWK
jgi:transporter family-2 protein